jgi:hypothetical protein
MGVTSVVDRSIGLILRGLTTALARNLMGEPEVDGKTGGMKMETPANFTQRISMFQRSGAPLYPNSLVIEALF